MIKALLLLVILCHIELPSHSAFAQAMMNSVTDFEDLIKCTTFVDKTNMIDTFFKKIGPRQFLMITYPRKFGKSTNLKMLKSFVEMSVNENGERMEDVNSTAAFRLFTDMTLDLKIGDKLSLLGNMYEKHFKKYAVIHVSFKIYGGSSYEHILKVLGDHIRTCFETYEWVYKKLSLNHPSGDMYSMKRKQVQFMEKVLNGHLDEDVIVNALFELSRILYENVNRNVFLLIDDYDAPLMKAFEHGEETAHLGSLIERIFAKLLNADHSYVTYAFITGTSNVFKSKFGNIKHFNFLENHPFVEYFGFTSSEMRSLFDKHVVSVNETKRIRHQYKSYKVSDSAVEIYNPFSIVSCLSDRDINDKKPLQNYWVESGRVPNFVEHMRKFKLCARIGELVVKRKIRFLLQRNIGTAELDALTALGKERTEVMSTRQLDLFFSYLYENGYLSYTSERNVYTIPNKEVESYYLHTLYVFYSDIGGLDLEEIRNAIGVVAGTADADNLMRFNCEQILEATFKKKFTAYHFTKIGDYHFQAIVYCAAKQNHVPNGEVSLIDLDEGKGQGVFMVIEVNDKVVFLLELKFEGVASYTERDEKLRVKKVCHKIIEQKLLEGD